MTKQEILDKLQRQNPTSIPVFKAMDAWANQKLDEAIECMNIRKVIYSDGTLSRIEETAMMIVFDNIISTLKTLKSNQ